VEVVGDGLFVDHRERSLLRSQGAREVPKVVDGQGEVGGERLANRLTVLPALRDGQHLEVGLDPVRDLEQDVRTFGRTGGPPGDTRRVRGVEGQFDVLRVGSSDLGEGLPVDR
jgi:hypothetical protein